MWAVKPVLMAVKASRMQRTVQGLRWHCWLLCCLCEFASTCSCRIAQQQRLLGCVRCPAHNKCISGITVTIRAAGDKSLAHCPLTPTSHKCDHLSASFGPRRVDVFQHFIGFLLRRSGSKPARRSRRYSAGMRRTLSLARTKKRSDATLLHEPDDMQLGSTNGPTAFAHSSNILPLECTSWPSQR